MPRSIFESATLKLTGYYLLIIAIICIVFSFAVYHFAARGLQYSLSHQTQRISEEYPGFDFSQALRNRHDYDVGAHRILINLMYFNVIVLGLAGFASYGLAKRTLKPIRDSHEQQQRFTADASHELRTPLTALTMSSEVALMDPSANKQTLRKALEGNLLDARKLNDLVTNLLRLTRLEAAEFQAGFEPVNLAEVIAEVVAGERPRAKKARINITNDIHDPLFVVGDRANLAQLFSIFIDNALKYGGDGKSITISGKTTESEVIITIEDAGIGIKAADLPHVFDRFYRADAARTRTDASGYGLGLSIAKLIADAHDGIIHISSQESHGTTVKVSIPSQKA
jgi:signal transduction histidine kinase